MHAPVQHLPATRSRSWRLKCCTIMHGKWPVVMHEAVMMWGIYTHLHRTHAPVAHQCVSNPTNKGSCPGHSMHIQYIYWRETSLKLLATVCNAAFFNCAHCVNSTRRHSRKVVWHIAVHSAFISANTWLRVAHNVISGPDSNWRRDIYIYIRTI